MSAKMAQVGVAWKKTTRDGKTFLSVVLTNPTGPDIRLSIWTNGFKEKDGQPDYIVYKSADERPAAARAAAVPEAEDGFPTDTPDDGVPF
jgi:uncharacterized protein (DUF736 family)